MTSVGTDEPLVDMIDAAVAVVVTTVAKGLALDGITTHFTFEPLLLHGQTRMHMK